LGHLSHLTDFDNLKSRTNRDSRLRAQEEKGELINRILEVIDNFEMTIDSVKNYRHNLFFDGILPIYRQLISVLREGIRSQFTVCS